MKVYMVLKNADFTEGRGPMVPQKIFSSLQYARDFVMDQSGIYGTQRPSSPAYNSPGVWNYDGYMIQEFNVLDGYDSGKVAELRKRRDELNHELNKIESEMNGYM